MSLKILLAGAALGLVAVPALAQQSTVPGSPTLPPTQPLATDRGYDKETPRTEAVNAAEAPVTAALNSTAGQDAAVASTATADMNAAARAQYDADREAYWAALVEHDRSVQRTDERYMRQQNAYADAMAAWRLQVEECKHGANRACKAPTPLPSQFY